jgi:hypothetical protein
MMREVSRHLEGRVECFFAPFYADGLLGRFVGRRGNPKSLMAWTNTVSAFQAIRDWGLPEDAFVERDYDLAVMGTDLAIPRQLRRRPILLLQEGMIDPETWAFALVRKKVVPRWWASTAAIGLSDAYERFCVASEGFRDRFADKGVSRDKMVVTGLPSFDDMESYRHNDFPLRGYVLAATSDTRETLKLDNRRKFIRRVLDIAAGRPVVFKLHPNENMSRSRREITRLAPKAEVFFNGPTAAMIANCDVLITQYSTVVFIGLALGKECHSYFDIEELKRLLPIQNGGRSAARIAEVCCGLVNGRCS